MPFECWQASEETRSAPPRSSVLIAEPWLDWSQDNNPNSPVFLLTPTRSTLAHPMLCPCKENGGCDETFDGLSCGYRFSLWCCSAPSGSCVLQRLAGRCVRRPFLRFPSSVMRLRKVTCRST